MIQQDAARILELKQQIKALEDQMAGMAESSHIACRLASIPGYGSICAAELGGEIVIVEPSPGRAHWQSYARNGWRTHDQRAIS